MYSQGRAVRVDNKVGESVAEEGRSRVYYFYVRLFGNESLLSNPPEHGFDLRTDPEDICFYVTGNRLYTGLAYKSRVGVVPEAAISAALK